MKKDKEIVLRKIRNMDQSKLHFVETDWLDNVYESQEDIKNEIIILKRCRSIEARVLKIIELAEYFSTYDVNHKFQCRKDANRSAVDIWRIYNNYFRPVSIFCIMRALYRLVVKNELDTLFCQDIKKQVFLCGDGTELDSAIVVNELGVRFAEWRTIGL